ncbi:MAG: hypothetical protein IJ949_07620, partial [Oscillospiraceae bacterium]|nr:hypothetical protein [Oscillospiraceae bacterium]
AEQQNKWDLALAFIENGKNASFIAETLGIPQADVNTLIAAVNAQRTASRSSGGGPGTKNTKKNENYETVVYAARKMEDPESAQKYLERMVEMGKISAEEALDIFLVELGYSLDTAPAENNGGTIDIISKITGKDAAKSVNKK